MASPTVDRRLGLVGNIAMKAPVAALAAGNITQSGQQTIDGVAVLAVNAVGVPDRVLCTGMTDATKNGIWDVSTAAWTRAADADGNYDLGQGSTVLVNGGVTYAGSYWRLTTSGAITIGTTSLTWARALASSLSTLTFTQTGTGAEDRDAQAKMRDFVSVLDFIPVAQHAAIAAGTSTYDCYASIMEAINSVTYLGTYLGSANRAGPAIYFPPGVYVCNTLIELKKRVTLFGDGSGKAYGDAAILKYPADVAGITIHTPTSGGTTTGGDASVIRGLALYSVGGASSTKHAITMHARASIENVYIENFPGDGYHIEATAGGGGSTEGNANCWTILGGRVNDCTGHGMYVDGADSNAGQCYGLDCSSNGGWGIFDSSFLGNTYIGCHTSGNVLGAYKSDGANARNVFLGCYSEGGQPASDIVKPALVIGGLHGANFTAGTTALTLGDSGVYTLDGSAGTPSLSFSANKTAGFYSIGTTVMGMSVNGANRGRFSNAAKFSTSGSYFGTGNDYHEFVQSSASLQSSIDYLTSAAYTGTGKVIKCDTASGTGFDLFTVQNAGATCFKVIGNGNAQNTNNSYGAISDVKLKENIAPAPSYWEKFKRYEFVSYTLKADPERQKMLGLVAQQAEQVSPGVVYETPDREDVETVGEDGERVIEHRLTGTTTKAVKYSVVSLQAEVVLQEAQRRIEALESALQALMAQFEAYKAAHPRSLP